MILFFDSYFRILCSPRWSRMLDERPNFFRVWRAGNIHQGASQTPNPIMFGRSRCDFDPPSPSQPMSAYNKDYLEISPLPS